MTDSVRSDHDIRMRGFSSRARVQEALSWVDRHAQRKPGESVEMEAACGRVLAEDVVAKMDVPPFDRSAMDGYALHGSETVGASDYNPLSFRVMGVSFPGRPFEGEVPPGTAVRIMTGAPIPAGADAVLPAEYAREADATVAITTSVAPGKHVGKRGEDIAADTTVLKTGRRLRPQDIGLLASIGREYVSVYQGPGVRLLITGNELVMPGGDRSPSQIYDANSSMIRGLVHRDGGRIESVVHVRDDRAAIRDAMMAPDTDVLLVSGGSSVGAEDHAPTLLAEIGELAIHGIAMRPSSPTGMGRAGETLVFLLPGNPVSCLCAYDFFAGRAIRLMGGRRADWPYPCRPATLVKKIVSTIGRVDYCRVRIRKTGYDPERQVLAETDTVAESTPDTKESLAPWELEPVAISGASILSSTTRADGFVIVPEEREGFAARSIVNVYLYDPAS